MEGAIEDSGTVCHDWSGLNADVGLGTLGCLRLSDVGLGIKRRMCLSIEKGPTCKRLKMSLPVPEPGCVE
jgi:hypothetical protein